ncbi:MAG TPA: FAD-dependent oxidoreductase [Bacteroidia bacterium]|nr:FAD-dependent oxidoreductase [Bacteroidia bacterium]
MNYSHWENDSYFNSVDLAIVGSGIVGLNAAIAAKTSNPALKVMVLEKGVVLMGASLRNAGFACFGSPTELIDDLKTRSSEQVFKLVEKRWKGLLALRSVVGDKNMEYEPFGGYEMFDNEASFTESKDAITGFNKEIAHITGEKETYRVSDDKINSFGFKGFSHMIENRCEAQINTGKMMRALISKAAGLGVILMNGIEVKDFKEEGDGVFLSTSWQNFKVKHLLFATNAYTSLVLKDIYVKPARAQVLITTPVEGLKVKGTFHYDKGYYYFRNVGQRLLFGGGRNLDFEGETTSELQTTEKIQAALETMLRERILPGHKYEIERRWSGIMGMGDGDKSPIIKSVSSHVHCAVRLGGMGVAIGTLVGQEAAAMVLKQV